MGDPPTKTDVSQEIHITATINEYEVYLACEHYLRSTGKFTREKCSEMVDWCFQALFDQGITDAHDQLKLKIDLRSSHINILPWS